MTGAATWDIIIEYHDGVLSVSKWFLCLTVIALIGVATR